MRTECRPQPEDRLKFKIQNLKAREERSVNLTHTNARTHERALFSASEASFR